MALSGTKAQEASLGQYGSAFVNGTDVVTPPDGQIICAITFMSDLTLQALQAENAGTNRKIFPSISNAAHTTGAGDEGTGGDIVTESTIFPKGLTIYGRWKSAMLRLSDADGGMIVYFAPKH